MNYNEYILALKLWCYERCASYSQELEKVQEQSGKDYLPAIGYLTASELAFKLLMRVDEDFASAEEFERSVLEETQTPYSDALKNLKNSKARDLKDHVQEEFSQHMHQLLRGLIPMPDCSDVAYERVHTGDAADRIIQRMREVWGYSNTGPWAPLYLDDPNEDSDMFFIMYDYLEPYLEDLAELFVLLGEHIYSYVEPNENYYVKESAGDVVDIGLRTGYTNESFTWFIYTSDETAVAFKGSIVDDVKKILSNEKEHWNIWEE